MESMSTVEMLKQLGRKETINQFEDIKKVSKENEQTSPVHS